MKKIVSFIWVVRAVCREIVIAETRRLVKEYPEAVPTNRNSFDMWLSCRMEWLNEQLIATIPESVREMAV